MHCNSKSMQSKDVILTVCLTMLYLRSMYLFIYLDKYELFYPFSIISMFYAYQNIRVYQYSLEFEAAFAPVLSSQMEIFAVICLILSFCSSPTMKNVELVRLHIIFFLTTRKSILQIFTIHIIQDFKRYIQYTMKPSILTFAQNLKSKHFQRCDTTQTSQTMK